MVRASFRIAIIVALIFTWFVTAAPSPGGVTITVTSTADGDLAALAGNDTCDLREAIQAANANEVVGECSAGSTEPGAVDTLAFSIGTAGSFQSIALDSVLLVNAPLIIDGSTQGQLAGGAPSIELTGPPETLLQFQTGSDGSTVRAIQFYSTAPDTAHVIYQSLAFVSSGNHHVLANYFNTDGTTSLGAAQLNLVLSASSGNWVGGPEDADRNLFGGPTGISFWNVSTTTIQNNYFGVQADGDTPLTAFTSTGTCIWLNSSTDSSTLNTIRDNVITSCAQGILLDGRAVTPPATINQTLIAGNHIGTNHDGTAALPLSYGIGVWGASDNTIGGTTPEDRNIISGNWAGIHVAYPGSTGNLIEGNYIGTNEAGTASLSGTTGYGVMLTGGADTTIGGSEPGSGNLISGLGYGIYTTSGATGTLILGNYIGTNAGATAAVPNNTGIVLGSDDYVGVWWNPGRNVIAGNTTGIRVADGAGVRVFGNKIGIDPSGTLDLGNSYGVEVESGGAAQIDRNWINHNSVRGVGFAAGAHLALPFASTDNCFSGNGTGLLNLDPAPVDFSGNWWGDVTGPTGGDPAGAGDSITGAVTYSPYTTVPAPACGPDARLSDGGATLAGVMAGSQLVGTSGEIHQVPFVNQGFSTVTIYSISIPAPFEIMPSSTCPVAGGSVNPGVVCYIAVRFSPTALGDTGYPELVVTSNAASSPNEAFFNGQGVAGTPILKNGSFEKDANGDKKPDNFAFTGFQLATDKRDCTVRKADLCSLKLIGNGATKTATQALVKPALGGHDDFTYSLWSKASHIPAGSVYRLQVLVYNGGTLVTTKTKNFAAGTHAWQQVRGSFSLSQPYTKIVFKITLDAASGTAWFDAGALSRAP